SAIALSLGCGLAYAASDYFRKAATSHCATTVVLLYFMGGQLPLLAAWLVYSGDTRLTASYWLPGAIDIVLGLGANALFIAAVRRSPLSLMVPLLALVPVLTAAAGAVGLREMLSFDQLAGTVLIVTGLLVLYNPPGYGLNLAATWRAFRAEPGVPAMLGTVTCWSLTPVFDKMCLQSASLPMHALIQVAVICALAGIWVVARHGTAGLVPPRNAWGPLVGGAVSAAAGYSLQLAAYQATLVAIAEGLKRVMGILCALVVGRVMFHEPINLAKAAGIAILAVGVPLILMG
ncbi:MAG: EamA family transporter, partial [Rhodospirillaceae bacterium]|nr:EamA family transporter [Rhodospirillaceae bacterium]